MAILPIDIATMAPKSQEASTSQATHIHRGEEAQTILHEDYNANVKQESRQTVEAKKDERPEYRYDESKRGGKGQYQPSDQKKRKPPEEEDNHKYPKNSGGTFDITI